MVGLDILRIIYYLVHQKLFKKKKKAKDFLSALLIQIRPYSQRRMFIVINT